MKDSSSTVVERQKRHWSAAPDAGVWAAINGVHGGRVFEAARKWGCDWREILDFSANINPLGPAPGVRVALERSIGQVVHYPENGSPRLCDAVARAWGLEPGHVMAGNGATELIYFLLRVLRPRRIHLVVPTFSEYDRVASNCELTCTSLGSAAYSIDWERLSADVARAKADWLVVTQPNNPTGAAFDPVRFLRWFDEERPRQTAVLLDESFADFTPGLSLAAEAVRRPRLWVLRSLTKFHALPGLRIGCLIGEAGQMAALGRVREPWQVNVLAEEAALAALADVDHQRRTLELVATERRCLLERLSRLTGVQPVPSQANFVFAHCDRPVGELQEFVGRRRILLRNCTGMPGITGEAFRMAVRTRPENEILTTALESFFGN